MGQNDAKSKTERKTEREETVTDPNSDSELRRKTKKIMRFENGAFKESSDFMATEEPLEIRVVFGPKEKRKDRSLSITMRTPGHDRELAAGFLLGEGIVKRPQDIERFENTGTKDEQTGESNQLCVHLAENVSFDFGSLQRNFYTTSSCGICGKASLEAVRAQLTESVAVGKMKVDPSVITSLPATLRKHQATFEETGGLHAAGLFHDNGELIECHEDVGRHNALDKLIGGQFLAGHLHGSDCIVLVSGRASFELVQKAVSAHIPMLVAVGAPSSLAVELAEEFGVALIGFVTERRFNVYGQMCRLHES